MRFFDEMRRDFSLCSANSTVGFQSADAPIRLRIAEPVQSRHRCSIGQKRSIANDSRVTILITTHDDEVTTWCATESERHQFEVGLTV